MSISYVRQTYGVPVKTGRRVRDLAGKEGRITGVARCVFVNGKRSYHPSELTYLDDEGNILWDPWQGRGISKLPS